MFKKTRLCSGIMLAFGGSLLLAGLPATAQQLERVEITGSSVRRIDAETALPVQVIKREDIVRSGATSIGDLMQRLPALQGGFTDSSGVGSGGGFAGASIHNIGETRTLVLLNGHRLAQFGGQSLTGSQAAMDLNAIPISAIERIEVLTDGASALYGADAIAGVVNFITRKNSSEGDITIGISGPKSGAREKRISATKGFGTLENNGFNVMLTWSREERTKLDAVQRDFGKTGKVFFELNGRKYRKQQFSASPIPANAIDDLDQLFSPFQKDTVNNPTGACPPKTFRVIEPYEDAAGNPRVDDYCGFDFVGELEIYPETKRDGFFGSASVKVGDQELFADLLLSKTKTTNRIAPVPGLISIPTTSAYFAQYLSAFTPYDLDGPGPGVEQGIVTAYRLYDLGKRTQTDDNKFTDLALGSRGALFGWDYNATYTHSVSQNKASIGGYPGALALGRLIDSGLLNPFVGPGQQSAPALAAINQTSYKGIWDSGTSKLDSVQLRGSREIFQLPAGPALLGLGVSYQRESFRSSPSLFAQAKLADPVAGTLCDPLAPSGSPLECDQRFGDESSSPPYSASRKSAAVFGELIIPATKELELTTSLRYDRLQAVGEAATIKGGFRLQPSKEVLVRGSIGTGFHAPTVPQLKAAQRPFGVTNNKYTCSVALGQVAASLGANCQAGNKQYDQLAGGNSSLEAEKSLQGTLGMRFEPSSQVSIGADLWHVYIRDQFGQLSEEVVFGKPQQFLSSWGTKRDTGTGIVYLAFLSDNRNLGEYYATGIDFDVSGRAKTPVGDLTSQVTMTYMLREKQQLERGGPFYSAINNFAEIGTVTFLYKGRWANTLKSGNWAHRLGMNFQSGYLDQETTAERLDSAGNVVAIDNVRLPVKRYVSWDWQTEWAARKDLSLTLGVLNLLNTEPPLAISTGGLNRGQQFGYDDRYFDSRGRTLYANLSYKF